MNKKIKELAERAGYLPDVFGVGHWDMDEFQEYTKLLVQECIDKIETYRIPCGNSAAGEMAAEWTYDALKSIRDDIKETFGVEQ